MSQFSYDCPHEGCRTRNSAFSLAHLNPRNNVVPHMTAICQTCYGSVIFVVAGVDNVSGATASAVPFGIAAGTYDIAETFPAPPSIAEFDYVHERVYKSFMEAEHNRIDGRLLSAAMGYRTTLERMLKLEEPNSARQSLYKRIENIAKNGGLPESLTKFMHEVRFLGNEVHELDDPSIEDVKAGADFTRLLLTYIYELPKRVDLAAERRARVTPKD